MSDIAFAAMAVRQDLLAEKLDVLATAMVSLIAELARANDIHTRTLESLREALRDRDDGDEWKRGGA